MAQPSVSSFFITRKRGIEDDIVASKKKVICLDRFTASSDLNDADDNSNKIVYPKLNNTNSVVEQNDAKISSKKVTGVAAAIRQGITPQRTRATRRAQMQNVDGLEVPKIVNFSLGGALSPQKRSRKQIEPVEQPKPVETVKPKQQNPVEELINNNHGMKTPTKNSKLTTETTTSRVEKTLMISTNTLNTDEIKKKLRASSKLTELKTSLNKLRNGFDKLDQMEQKRKESGGKALKPFKNIELEILR